MIYLVFVACLANAPDRCAEHSLGYVEPMSPYACALRAQPELAKWAERHPQHVITSWRCEAEGRRSFRI